MKLPLSNNLLGCVQRIFNLDFFITLVNNHFLIQLIQSVNGTTLLGYWYEFFAASKHAGEPHARKIYTSSTLL